MNRLVISCALVLAPTSVLAFGGESHRQITKAVLQGDRDTTKKVSCPQEFAILGFLGFLYDSLQMEEIKQRWKNRQGFDLLALKSLLDLSRNKEVRVAGMDFLPCDDDMTVMGLLLRECTRPDEDLRNQKRFAYSEDGKEIRGARYPYPDDPIVLDMGGIYGLRGQAHAHYVLKEGFGGWLGRDMDKKPVSSNPFLLFKEPESFALGTSGVPSVITLGADMAISHLLVALAASYWHDEAQKRLSLAFFGHSLHYVQDASDPLHTVQVGNICVARRAGIEFLKRALLSFGGFLGDLQSPTAAVGDALSNLHLFAEALWDDRHISVKVSFWHRIYAHLMRLLGSDIGVVLFAADIAALEARQFAPSLFEALCKCVKDDLFALGFVLEDGKFRAEDYVKDEEACKKVEEIGRISADIALSNSLAFYSSYKRLATTNDKEKVSIVFSLLAKRIEAVKEREMRLREYMAKNPDGTEPPSGGVRLVWFLIGEIVLILVVLRFGLWLKTFRRRPSAQGRQHPSS
jgi:hypothetical protein